MMLDTLRALSHPESDDGDDEILRREAHAFLAQNPSLQLAAELVGKLRNLDLSWWSPEFSRSVWPATMRMRWLKQRRDLRQSITTRLTGLSPNAARRIWADDQASLIDAVIDAGDIDVATFERAFDPFDLVVYGPAREFWTQFRERLPVEEDTPQHQKLFAWLLRALTADRSAVDGLTRKPILTALDVRSAIDVHVWQERIPFEMRVEVDQARLKHERQRPREPFGARHELAIITPERIVSHIPLVELSEILARAEKAMGLDGQPIERSASSSDAPISMDSPPIPSIPTTAQIN